MSSLPSSRIRSALSQMQQMRPLVFSPSPAQKVRVPLPIHKLAAAVLMLVILAQASVFGMVRPSTSTDLAVVSEVKGLVLKQLPLNSARAALSHAQKAIIGDKLPEGTQVTTGPKSSIQIKWPDIVARAWSNSVFSISPERRMVYVGSGEVLIRLNKNRKDKQSYLVATKFLQARVHGTTILIQSDGTASRVTVLEGFISVLNRIDRSLMKVDPGVVYEIKTLAGAHVPQPSDHLALNGLDQMDSAQARSLSFCQIESKAVKPVHAFVTSGEMTNLYACDPKTLVNHPLVKQFDEPLDSAKLIEDTMEKISIEIESSPPEALQSFPEALLHAVRVEQAPETSTYTIGHDVEKLIPHDADVYTENPPAAELKSGQEPDAAQNSDPGAGAGTTGGKTTPGVEHKSDDGDVGTSVPKAEASVDSAPKIGDNDSVPPKPGEPTLQPEEASLSSPPPLIGQDHVSAPDQSLNPQAIDGAAQATSNKEPDEHTDNAIEHQQAVDPGQQVGNGIDHQQAVDQGQEGGNGTEKAQNSEPAPQAEASGSAEPAKDNDAVESAPAPPPMQDATPPEMQDGSH